MRSLIIGALLGAVIAFVWQGISWMALPWHCKSMKKIRNEEFVGWVLKENARKDGVYVIPHFDCDGDEQSASWKESAEQGPYVFASIRTKGISGSMLGNSVTSFVMFLILSGIATALLMRTGGLSYAGRVLFVFGIGTISAIVATIPMWNWFAFPMSYTLINLGDTLITWLLVGLGIAATTPSLPIKKKR